jgi:hypothetical protein
MLAANKQEFQRLKRDQIRIVALTPVCALGYGVLVAVLAEPEWADWLPVPLVFLAIGAIGWLEIKKLAVFRKDLRERRDMVTGLNEARDP